ncbi:MAG: DUF192 domain-containing protein [Actinomycetota bacterium]|nr:DUF192 domain-containing protein [Actinomycetota bacterium]
MRRLWGLVVCSALFVACGYGALPSAGTSSPAASPSFNSGTVLIDTSHGSVLVHVLVAQTPDQWSYGLMNRDSVPADAGMIFLFESPTTSGFWMKDTKVPLSIAFFDVHGKIERILDMDPCAKAPCRMYSPGLTYNGALEVNQGAFEKWGVSSGDTIHLTQSGT